MAYEDHIGILRHSVEKWNLWREQNPDTVPDLRKADLSGAILHKANLRGAILNHTNLIDADLRTANLSGANLYKANLRGATLIEANLGGANLSEAVFQRANLSETNLIGANLYKALLQQADLSGANLYKANLFNVNLNRAILIEADLYKTDLTSANLTSANLTGANLTWADLSEASLACANLTRAILVQTNLTYVDLRGCYVFGISAWDVKLEGAKQKDLVITRRAEPAITVDKLEVAQFIYLLLSNENIRQVIDTVTSKVVLILGRFVGERKKVLDALRDELRSRNFSPVLFDVGPSSNQDISDTITLLARMARFVIADLSDPRSVQQELTLIALQVMVAIRPIILAGEQPWSMFSDLQRRSHGLLPVHEYRGIDELVRGLQKNVIVPAEAKRRELLPTQSQRK